MDKETKRRLNELAMEVELLRQRVVNLEQRAAGHYSYTVRVGPAEYKEPTITVPPDWGTCGSGS